MLRIGAARHLRNLRRARPAPRRGLNSLSSTLSAAKSYAPGALALVVPTQGVRWSYEELEQRTSDLAAELTQVGYTQDDALVCSLPDTAENLLLQLACSRIGVAFVTIKGKDVQTVTGSIQALMRTRGVGLCAAHVASAQGNLPDVLSEAAQHCSLPLPTLHAGIGEAGSLEFVGEVPRVEPAPIDDEDEARLMQTLGLGFEQTHALYGGTVPIANKELMTLGVEAGTALDMTSDDSVCVSITLGHAFGAGSAVASTLLAGATLLLPAPGALLGCDDRVKKVAVSVDLMKEEQATLLFADSHTLAALPSLDGAELPALRGGAVKVGSGNDFMEEVTHAMIGGEERALQVAGARLIAVGKRA